MARQCTRCTTCFRYIAIYLLPSSNTAPRAHLGTSHSLVLEARYGRIRWLRFSLRSEGTPTPSGPSPHPPTLLLHPTSAHAVFLQTIDHVTGNSSLLMAMNIAG